MTTKTNREQIASWADNYKYKTLNKIAKKLYGESNPYNNKKALFLINRMKRLNRISFVKVNSGIQFKPNNSFMV